MACKLRILSSMLVATPLVLAAAGSVLTAQDRVTELQFRFAHEPDAIRKAKLMPRLGDAQFQEIERDFLAGRLTDALAVLDLYRDEAQTCIKELDAKGTDAERHPAGFKQLQFSLRESLRRLDDLLIALTTEEEAVFEGPRKDIDDVNRHVIRELFPRQPAGDQTNPKAGH